MTSPCWYLLRLLSVFIFIEVDNPGARPADLIRLLGDPSSEVRDSAHEKLFRLGRLAAEELKRGMADPDPEVRRRCAALYPLAVRTDEDIRLERFVDDEASESPPPTGWVEFRRAAGRDRLARLLYVEVWRRERTFLINLDRDPSKVGKQFQARLCKIFDGEGWLPVGRARYEPLTAADLAMVFIAAAKSPESEATSNLASVQALCWLVSIKQQVRDCVALKRICAFTMSKHLNDPEGLAKIVGTPSLVGMTDYEDAVLKPAVRKLTAKADGSDGRRLGFVLKMVEELHLSDVKKTLEPAIRRAAVAFAAHPGSESFQNARNGAVWAEMPEIEREILNPTVDRLLRQLPEHADDYDWVLRLHEYCRDLGRKEDLDRLVIPAMTRIVVKLLTVPFDRKALDKAQSMSGFGPVPDFQEVILKRAARQLIKGSTEADDGKVTTLALALEVSRWVRGREEDPDLAALAVQCAVKAAETDDVEALTRLCELTANRGEFLANVEGFQSVRDEYLKPAVRRALLAAERKPLREPLLSHLLAAAVELRLREALPLAIRGAQDTNLDGLVRAWAVVAIAQNAGKERFRFLESLLPDQSLVRRSRMGAVAAETRLCDVVLASLLYIEGGQVGDYGFVYPRTTGKKSGWSLSPMDLGFMDDDDRDAAMKKWKDRVGVRK